jgi:hypothetical protein
MNAEELRENAERAFHDPAMTPVSITMAILSVLVAIATVLAHGSHTAEVMNRTKSHELSSLYQAEDSRGHEDELFLSIKNAVVAAEVREKVAQEAESFSKDKDIRHREAEELERRSEIDERRGDHYDQSEVFLEISLLVTSITQLSRRRYFWYLGLLMSMAGIAEGLMGWLMQ